MNYTWSKSLDFNQYVGTGSPSNSPLDPANPKADYGLSSNDVRNRFVVNAVYTPSFRVSGWQNRLANGWGLSGMFQAQAGLPFTLGTNGAQLGAFSGPLGTGINRLPYMRNTFNYPGTAILDSRLTKRITVREGMTAELFGEMFNALNKINVTSVNTTGYAIGGTTAAPTLTYNAAFGSYQNANSNFVYNPRQVQLGARLNF